MRLDVAFQDLSEPRKQVAALALVHARKVVQLPANSREGFRAGRASKSHSGVPLLNESRNWRWAWGMPPTMEVIKSSLACRALQD